MVPYQSLNCWKHNSKNSNVFQCSFYNLITAPLLKVVQCKAPSLGAKSSHWPPIPHSSPECLCVLTHLQLQIIFENITTKVICWRLVVVWGNLFTSAYVLYLIIIWYMYFTFSSNVFHAAASFKNKRAKRVNIAYFRISIFACLIDNFFLHIKFIILLFIILALI